MRRWTCLVAAALALAGCSGPICETMSDNLTVPAAY